MSLQWTIVAGFLYVEVGVLIVLLLPFISARRWQSVFRSRFITLLSSYSTIYFNIFLFLLILLMLDAIRTIYHYSYLEDKTNDINLKINTEMRMNMKLFRAQRNFYITTMALVLWITLRRLVSMISQMAQLQATNEAALKQASSATAAAQQLLDNNEKEKSATPSASNAQLEKELKDKSDALFATKTELVRLQKDFEVMKQQGLRANQQYDTLLEDHADLQKRFDRLQGTGGDGKKDS